MTAPRFNVTCIHCGVIVLITPRIVDVDLERLVKHVVSVHPTVPLYSATLARVLDHFTVRPEPGGRRGPR